VENSVSGLGVCAKRCAIDHTVLRGNSEIETATAKAGKSKVLFKTVEVEDS